jgi:N-succinyldiaminopimelate aminotransferase
MNPDLQFLHPYPFEKLKQLKEQVSAPAHLEHIALSIGEPRHPAPHFVIENLIAHTHLFSSYPLTKGVPALREAIGHWLQQRFQLKQAIDAETQILPVNGTREALFAFAHCIVDRSAAQPLVLMPNPFYQIYEGAALLAGAQLLYMNCHAENNFLPDLDTISDAQWDACQLIYICSPGNPTGAVMPLEYLQKLIRLAQQHDFVIASDECYSEIYFDEDNPPPGLLQAAADMGIDNFAHCVVFHSLSKRSNLPGLRSGFVAGDAAIIEKFLLYHTYHGCAMPPATQSASIVAWQDEHHVVDNRSRYREKFERFKQILDGTLTLQKPDAGFYFWASTPIDDTEFAQQLFARKNITVLPGQYLSRDTEAGNPGAGYVRMALVAELDECIDAANRIKQFSTTL